MRYQVPQFLEVEDKIFGSLTAKQFLYVGGAAATGFIVWNILPPIIAVIVGAPIVILLLMFAFFKFDGWQPFVQTFENSMKYFIGNKKYIWKKVPKKLEEKKEETSAAESPIAIPKLSDSKLKDLSWSLDINENIK
ncbi:MAG TPA: PrgI family protein [Candidatus Paceibacterota bacterium]|nr:PrgI family protein [Candidatus Paceibacterota bacterium]HRZ34239.1 PrgI family protein [Candidatus Paceibacterota bacterium]